MKSLKLRVVGMVAATSLLACTTALADTDSTTPKPKTAVTTTKKGTSSTAHKTTKSAHSKARTSSSTSTTRKGKKSKKVSKRGQQKIDSDRTHQIQQALIREHYMSGEPSGKWDADTEAALRKFQADHGWQNKTVPDSRALIKLGLGPSHDHLLNPESAMTTAPDAPHPTSAPGGNTPPNGPAQPASQPQP